MDIYEIVIKLVGKIDPVGETNEDNRRFENLKVMTQLVDALVIDLWHLARISKNRGEFSMKRAGEYTVNFLKTNLGME